MARIKVKKNAVQSSSPNPTLISASIDPTRTTLGGVTPVPDSLEKRPKLPPEPIAKEDLPAEEFQREKQTHRIAGKTGNPNAGSSQCLHLEITVESRIDLLDSASCDRHEVELQVYCTNCKARFEFINLPFSNKPGGARITDGGRVGHFCVVPSLGKRT